MKKFLRNFSLFCFPYGSSTRQFGVHVWGHRHRVGLEIHFWKWELQIMYDRYQPW